MPIFVQHALLALLNAAVVAVMGAWINSKFQKLNGYVHHLEERVKELEDAAGSR